MRILGQAIAFAGIVAATMQCTIAGELLTPDRPIGEAVDHYIAETLRKEGLKPAPPANAATLLRRLMLDLAGRIPTAAESRAFVTSTDPEKIVRLVDRLLASPGFVRHQTTELDTMLMAGNRGSLRDYLVRAVGENRSWDRIFRELMLPDQTDPIGKVAAEFLRARVKDTDRLTAEVSSTFFGVNISCAQCHDHPLVLDWKQDHFYGMKAFFDRTLLNGNAKGAFLAERGFGTSRFKTTEGVERPARMMFLTGRKAAEAEAGRDATKDEQKQDKERLQKAQKDKVPPSPPRFSARAKLVEIALAPEDREFFARAVVNRIWSRLFGRGLVTPLDQMHSANPPSHPELLDWLARDTIAHGYDLRRLIRGLVLSRAYGRDSRWEAGEPPRPSLFAMAAIRPLTPMQLACSLRIATADPATLAEPLKPAELDRQIEGLAESARSMASSLGSSGGDSQIGVAEALLFSNGKPIDQELLSDRDGRLVARLLKLAAPADQIDLAVRNVLSREPDDEEKRVLREYLERRTDRPEDACRQLVWALLTSPEFRFNH
jgi:Protein of unknown function (DUF1549)/Protein of unknown function (DUF1553)